jgi:hypothetical protein
MLWSSKAIYTVFFRDAPANEGFGFEFARTSKKNVRRLCLLLVSGTMATLQYEYVMNRTVRLG